MILEKTCIIGRPKPICDTCELGTKVSGDWMCDDWNLTCCGESCLLDKPVKCDVGNCGFTTGQKAVYKFHRKLLHGI